MVACGQKMWVDGAILDYQEAKHVSLMTHTLHYGVGAFEGIRAYEREGGETTLFRLREHVERLFDSCKLVFMTPQVTREQLVEGCLEVLRQSEMKAGYLRPLCLLGEGAMGLLPEDNPVHCYVVAWEWGAYLGQEALERGIRCKISSFARHHINVSFSRGKLVGQYVNSVVAKREAKLGGYDEAILLDPHGFVSEGSGENIFLVRRGEVVTPPQSASILPGITRDTIMVLARERGLDVREERFTRDELYLADEVFLTGTAAEVTPVCEVDDRAIGDGSVGPVTRQLQAAYFEIVRGSDDSHPEWLTRV